MTSLRRVNLEGPYLKHRPFSSFPLLRSTRSREIDPAGILRLSSRLAAVEGGLPSQYSLARQNRIETTHVCFEYDGEFSQPYPYIRVRSKNNHVLRKIVLTPAEMKALAAHLGLPPEHALALVYAFTGGKHRNYEVIPSLPDSFRPDYFTEYMQFLAGGKVPAQNGFQLYIPHQSEGIKPTFPYIVKPFAPPSWIHGHVAEVKLSRHEGQALATLSVGKRQAAFELTELEAKRTLLPEELEADIFNQTRLADFFAKSGHAEICGFAAIRSKRGRSVLNLGPIGKDKKDLLLLRPAGQSPRIDPAARYYVRATRDRDSMRIEVFAADKNTLLGTGETEIEQCIPVNNPIEYAPAAGARQPTPTQADNLFPQKKLARFVSSCNDGILEGSLRSFKVDRSDKSAYYVAIHLGLTQSKGLMVEDRTGYLLKPDRDYWVELVREDNSLTIKVSAKAGSKIIGIAEAQIVYGEIVNPMVALEAVG